MYECRSWELSLLSQGVLAVLWAVRTAGDLRAPGVCALRATGAHPPIFAADLLDLLSIQAARTTSAISAAISAMVLVTVLRAILSTSDGD